MYSLATRLVVTNGSDPDRKTVSVVRYKEIPSSILLTKVDKRDVSGTIHSYGRRTARD